MILENRLGFMANFEMEIVKNVINKQEILNKFITGSHSNWQLDFFFFLITPKMLNIETGKSRKLSPVSTQE